MLTETEFNDHLREGLPKLRNVIRKMVGHPEQCEDIVQDVLSKAWESKDSFEKRSVFSTWLCSIGVRTAIDYLRRQKLWRTKAQVIYADQCLKNEALGMEVGQAFSDPSTEYVVKEHIAYCFSCVGRSLPPMKQGALFVKEVLSLTNIEGAKVLGLSESLFRQHLSEGRKDMDEKYEGLCALVNKNGVCYQCKGLREGFPPEKKGPWLSELDTGLAFELRMKIVREANIDTGKTQLLHEIFWKRTEEVERKEIGDESVTTDCGKEES